MQIDFSVFPSVPFRQRGLLPSTEAVYLLLYGNTVLYVGTSSNLRSRWEDHDIMPDLRKHKITSDHLNLHIAWMGIKGIRNRRNVERLLVRDLRPRFNKQSHAEPYSTEVAIELLEDAITNPRGGIDMYFEDVLPYARMGYDIFLEDRPDRVYRIRDDAWYCCEVKYQNEFLRFNLDIREILSGDWNFRRKR